MISALKSKDEANMSLLVVFLFMLGTAVELYGLLGLSSVVGSLNTISLTMFAFLTGVFVNRSWDSDCFTAIYTKLRMREFPSDEEIHASVMALAGWLFITPGPVSDVAALIIIIPYTRDKIKGVVRGMLEKRIAIGQQYFLFKNS
jgi:UPF0716 protein FxsA